MKTRNRRNGRSALVVLAVLGLATSGASGDTLRVPSQYPTIQEAIFAATHGDTVLVADGTYTGTFNKNIDFGGLAIIVRSENGPENCTIDCQGVGRGFQFRWGETRESVLDGFTVRHGQAFAFDGGAGIRCSENSGPTIRNCIIELNQTPGVGGGIACENSAPIIVDCVIRNNRAGTLGGGLSVVRSNPVVLRCLIAGNEAGPDRNDAHGAGMYITNRAAGHVIVTDSVFVGNRVIHDTGFRATGGAIFAFLGTLDISGCTFLLNDGVQTGGAIYCSSADLIIHNTILWDNTAAVGHEIAIDNSELFVSYSDIEGGFQQISSANGSTLNWGDGNIVADPLFFNPGIGDYHLLFLSPCIDVGDPNGNYVGQADIDGELRVWNGRVDMGADEFGSRNFGDLNCDGAFNGGDIDPFFLALGDPAAYAIAFPTCEPLLGDMNGDGRLDGGDIDPFFACLGGGCP